MRRTLRAIALAVLVVAAGVWLFTGANRSWTRNNEEIKTVDPVTGLDRIEWKGTFVPGVDFLGAAAGMAMILAGGSFIFRDKKAGN